MSIKGQAYIAGAWNIPPQGPGQSVAELHAECARGALEDAGLSKRDVDGYFCAGDAPGMGPLNMVDYMNLRVRHVDATDIGGSSYIALVAHAAEAIAARQVQGGADHAGRAAAQRGPGHRHRRARGQSARRRTRCSECPYPPDDREHVRDVRDAAHARVRHDQRAARLDQGRGLATTRSTTRTPMLRDVVTVEDVVNSPMVVRPAAPPGLLRDLAMAAAR
ncbi:MAG: hypothetical protein WKF73_13975 [Nocardioidaceae bacterium]